MVLEKNCNSLCTLFYRKKFYKEASTVADHILACFLYLYGKEVLLMFDFYYQDLAKETKQISSHPYYKNKIKLNNTINDNVDLKQIIEDKLAAKKRVRIYKEDNVTITSYKTIDYITNNNKEEPSYESIDINQSISTSARSPQRPLAPK